MGLVGCSWVGDRDDLGVVVAVWAGEIWAGLSAGSLMHSKCGLVVVTAVVGAEDAHSISQSICQ